MRMKKVILVIMNLFVCTTGTGEDFPWTRKLEKKAEDIYLLTLPISNDHAEKMKVLWDQEFPQYKDRISGDDLLQRVRRNIGTRSEKSNSKGGEQRDYYRWDRNSNAEVIHIYHHTGPNKKNHSGRMHDCWAKMNPNVFRKGRKLKERAQILKNTQYQPTAQEAEQARLKFEKVFPSGYICEDGKTRFHHDTSPKFRWTPELDDVLIEMFNDTNPRAYAQKKRLKEKWDERYPHLKDKITDRYLRERAITQITKKTGIDNIGRKRRMSWTRDLNADVLHIAKRTNTSVSDHAFRMHECWTRIHPEFDEYDKANLKARARYLLERGYRVTDIVKGIVNDPYIHGMFIILASSSATSSWKIICYYHTLTEKEEAENRFNKAYPSGYSWKGKEVMLPEEPATTSHSKKTMPSGSEEIVPIHQEDPVYSLANYSHFSHYFDDIHHPNVTRSSQLTYYDSNTDTHNVHHDKGISSEQHRGFIDDFNNTYYHHISASSQLLYDDSHPENHTDYPFQEGSSSQTHVKNITHND